jgi:aconitate hydratase
VVLQDFTGVPLLADLAAMRSAAARLGKDAARIEPLVPVDLVVDHSIMVDHYGTKDSLDLNMKLEFQRNAERYEFMKWGMQAVRRLSAVVPPASASCTRSTWSTWRASFIDGGRACSYPDSLVGTEQPHHHDQRHRVVGWGVGRASRPRPRCWGSRSTC